jgi:hypothetical protein
MIALIEAALVAASACLLLLDNAVAAAVPAAISLRFERIKGAALSLR